MIKQKEIPCSSQNSSESAHAGGIKPSFAKGSGEAKQKNNTQKTDLQNLISEIKSLEDDLEEYKKGIQKIKDAPHDKNANVVGTQHKELVAELEDIANKLEELPKKWEKEIKD